jgi:hypothetical protein
MVYDMVYDMVWYGTSGMGRMVLYVGMVCWYGMLVWYCMSGMVCLVGEGEEYGPRTVLDCTVLSGTVPYRLDADCRGGCLGLPL